MNYFNNDIINNSKRVLKSKYGISMAILAVTIAVGLILISVGIVTVSHAINDASKTAFAEELNTIQSQVRAYYAINDELPVQTSGDNLVTIDKSEIESTLLSIDNNAKNAFDTELVSNGENSNSTFYVVDLSKLDLDKVTRGNKTGGENDIYIVSPATNIVYYLLGVEISNEYYFSLSERLISYTNTNLEVDANNAAFDTQTSGSLSVKRLKKSWTNKLNIILNANVENGETISFDINGTQYTMASDNYHTGDNSISIDNLFTGTNNLASMLTNSSDLESNIRAASSITIKKGTDSVTLDISNLDLDNPTVSDEVTIDNTASTKTNKVTFTVSDSNNGSGIKEVRYDYLTKYDEDGEVTYNYKNGNENIDAIDKYYIKAKGKKASVSNEGKVSIEVPKDIEAIQVLAVDKAGNMSEETRASDSTQVVPIRNISTDMYIGCTLDVINSGGMTFRVALRVNNEEEYGYLTDYEVSISTDLLNYLNQNTKTYTITENEYIYSAKIEDFKQSLAIEDKVYIKIKATTSNRYEMENVFEFSKDDGTNSSFIGNNVVDIVNSVPIPKGFVASKATGEDNKANGLVIYEGTTAVNDDNVESARETRNQFVWVPVEVASDSTFEDTFVRVDGYGANGVQQTYVSSGNATEPYSGASDIERNNYNKMYASVKKYGGFYIARYETSNNGENLPKSTKYGSPWAIKFANSMTDLSGGAYEISQMLYPENSSNFGVVSQLIHGVQWDATVRWLKNNYPDIETNGEDYGNIKNATFTYIKKNGDIYETITKNSGTSTLVQTGSSEHNKTNNIYDLDGNKDEQTVESMYTSNRILRGGLYNLNNNTSMRNYTTYNVNVGFRIALYVK